jgi:hypothetical protein
MSDLTASELEELRKDAELLTDALRSFRAVGRRPTEVEVLRMMTLDDALPALLDAAEQNARRGRLLTGCALTLAALETGDFDKRDIEVSERLRDRIAAELSPRPDPKRSERDNPERD